MSNAKVIQRIYKLFNGNNLMLRCNLCNANLFYCDCCEFPFAKDENINCCNGEHFCEGCEESMYEEECLYDIMGD